MQLRGCRLLIRCIRIKRLCTHFVISRQASIPPSPGHCQILHERMKGGGDPHTQTRSPTCRTKTLTVSAPAPAEHIKMEQIECFFYSAVFCNPTMQLNGVNCSLVSYEMSEWKSLYDLDVTKHLWQTRKYKHNLLCKKWKAWGKSSPFKK